MTLISDTLHYRPDGTVSSVTRVTTDTYVHPKTGVDVTETSTETTDLSAVSNVLDAAYAANAKRHAELEQQIVDERQAAEAMLAAAVEQANKNAKSVQVAFEAEIAIRDARLATISQVLNG